MLSATRHLSHPRNITLPRIPIFRNHTSHARCLREEIRLSQLLARNVRHAVPKVLPGQRPSVSVHPRGTIRDEDLHFIQRIGVAYGKAGVPNENWTLDLVRPFKKKSAISSTSFSVAIANGLRNRCNRRMMRIIFPVRKP